MRQVYYYAPLDSVWWTICGQNTYNEKLNHLIYK